MLKIILLIIALVCFILRAVGISTGRVDLGWLGLAFLTGAFLF